MKQKGLRCYERMGGDITILFHRCWLKDLSMMTKGKASTLSSVWGWSVGIQLQVSHQQLHQPEDERAKS